MPYTLIPPPVDEDTDLFFASLLIKEYGDLLKISRTRGVMMSLPALRKYVSSNEYLIRRYEIDLRTEISGQGLSEDAVLNSLVIGQLVAIRNGDNKNNTKFASEIKSMVQKGVVDEEAIGKAESKSEKRKDLDAAVKAVLERPLEVEVDKISSAVADVVRAKLLSSFEVFSRWSFEIQMGFPFQMQDFHSLIFDLGQRIVDGEIDRAIVTIPPRHSKTQLLSIFLPLYSFCHNPGSHNIITSYAEDVVLESSGYIRQIMTDDLFQKIFPKVRIDASKRALDRWGTTRSGVMHAVPTGGKLTGKGAGSLATIYSGSFVVDDPIKPKDAYSPAVRNEVNDRFDNTFMSRLANDGCINDAEGNEIKCPRTPMVVIMQRVHDDDLVGYLLRGKSSDKYHWLNIPAILEEGTGSTEWYDKIITRQAYTHCIPITYSLKRKEYPSALWPARKSLSSLIAMREANPYTFWSQYMGDPTAKGTGLVQDEWLRFYTELPKKEIIRTYMTVDTASTIKDYSDFSVCCLWHETRTKDLYLGDLMIGKYEIPELKEALIKFWLKHNKLDVKFPCMLPQAMYMEDKSSGQFLNQQFIREGKIRVLPVPRDSNSGDKIARFLNTIPYFSQGRLYLPFEHEHKAHVVREICGMTAQGSGTGNDDVVDNFSDACIITYGKPSANYMAWVGTED